MRKAGTLLAWLTFVSAAVAAPATPPATVSPAVPLPFVQRPAPPLRDVAPSRHLRPQAVHRLLGKAMRAPALGPRVELAVVPLGRGGPIVRMGSRKAVTPASLLKLLTMTAALEVVGTDHRFQTSVVRGRHRSDVVLVGGGDPLLAVRPPGRGVASTYPKPATLASLAQDTARHLKHAGITRVHVQYDASLFQGPAVDPAWPHFYLRENVVSRISPLWVNEGRVHPGAVPRQKHPALAAARVFVRLLRHDGVAVAASVGRAAAAPDAAVLAQVLSPPLYEIVQHILAVSDNEGAEVLLRQTAIAAGRPGSFRGGVRAVRAALAHLGLTLAGARFSDGSGLARSDRLPLRLLLDVLQLASGSQHPELHTLVSALPVAGFNGSLAYRFTDARAGLGVVRAKTGTLRGVSGLAGLVSTRDGSALVFALVADQTPARRTLRAEAGIDRVAALLATCGCTRR